MFVSAWRLLLDCWALVFRMTDSIDVLCNISVYMWMVCCLVLRLRLNEGCAIYGVKRVRNVSGDCSRRFR